MASKSKSQLHQRTAHWLGDETADIARWALRGMIAEAIRQTRASILKSKAGIEKVPPEIWPLLLEDFVVTLDEELRKGLSPMELTATSKVVMQLALRLEGVPANDNDTED